MSTDPEAKAKLAAMSTPDLLKLYNSLTRKSVKRFSSRKAGEAQVLAALKQREAAPPEAPPAAEAAAPPAAAPRSVTKMAGKMGRPILEYTVALAEGKSTIRQGSLRGRILKFMKEAGTPSVGISKLEAAFGKKVKGAVLKLLELKWLVRCDDPQ